METDCICYCCSIYKDPPNNNIISGNLRIYELKSDGWSLMGEIIGRGNPTAITTNIGDVF